MLECVVNISEGRRTDALSAISAELGHDLLDIHSDVHHHRSVFTLVGTNAARELTKLAAKSFDLSSHIGVHPRIGIIDVVPFIALDDSTMTDAITARNEYAEFAAQLDIPIFFYGPERELPEIRRRAFNDLVPDNGPSKPHPTVGAICVGAREVLVAYNVWLKDVTLSQTRQLARELRRPEVRTLGLQLGEQMQLSMNLVSPSVIGPAEMFDEIASRVQVSRAELVGLVPSRVLVKIPKPRWTELDLSLEKTIEYCVARRNRALAN